MKTKWVRCIFVILCILVLIVIVNFMPTLSLKTDKMTELEGKWINVYYETEAEAAKDVYEYAEQETAAIAERLDFSEAPDVNVYIYDHQRTMQTKKYGLIAPLLCLDWYIGDNVGTDVILTSPANPGKVHTYENNKYAVLHEIVHAYASVLNEDVDLWLSEGCALYLTNGEPFYKEYIDQMGIPTYKETCSDNPLIFSNCGGYTYAHIYIEYIEVTYGWNAVLEIIRREDYEDIFAKSKEDIYDEWVEYLKAYYQ
ncbi:MAG TPA: hypothetical protein DHV96_05640 [Lachnospiraceae bacterium]|nr:hypothetical protein [Lachnospiraceae bacterium]